MEIEYNIIYMCYYISMFILIILELIAIEVCKFFKI